MITIVNEGKGQQPLEERIAELEQQLAECQEKVAYKAEYIADMKHMHVEERRDARKRRLELQTELAECQRERDALRDALEKITLAYDPQYGCECSTVNRIANKALEKD